MQTWPQLWGTYNFLRIPLAITKPSQRQWKGICPMGPGHTWFSLGKGREVQGTSFYAHFGMITAHIWIQAGWRAYTFRLQRSEEMFSVDKICGSLGSVNQCGFYHRICLIEPWRGEGPEARNWSWHQIIKGCRSTHNQRDLQFWFA